MAIHEWLLGRMPLPCKPVMLLFYEVLATHSYYNLCRPFVVLLSMPSILSVFVSTCPVLFASWKEEVIPLEKISLWFCRELANCHLCVAGTCQDAGSPLGCGQMTGGCSLSAVLTRPIALLLSIWEMHGDVVLVALRGRPETFFRFWLGTSPVDPLS